MSNINNQRAREVRDVWPQSEFSLGSAQWSLSQ
ncbi:MAG: hypothetical protein PWQ67_1976 [Clostridia bacterium]|nr:hypothetical protein [Clostridia bacterium]MDN5323522.1 hypothetical protein [Clostridia bacterium]